MMDKFQEFLNNLQARFQELNSVQKAIALGLVAAALASVFVITLWSQTPDYQVLYANLDEADASAIVDQLKNQNIEFKLGNQGKTVRVPSNLVHELRLTLASKGLPNGKEVGLELFEDTPLGMTEFVQKLNYQRALQGELARTVSSLDAVETARIHLVIPKEDVFLKDKPRGKASVTLKFIPGRSLSETQVMGIVHLISSSVERVEAKDVVVVDLKGNILSGSKDISEAAMMTGSNYKHKRRVENELERSIVRMMEDALGEGKVIARVTADINFDKVEKTEEIYDPDSQVVRSEQSNSESVVGAVPPGGVAGVETLLPDTQGQEGGGIGAPAKRDNQKQTFNYEINKVIRHVSQPTGEVKKISVAVLVDGSVTGDPPTYQARSDEEMAKYLDIVKSAVGYDDARGDQIKLENIQFDRSLEVQRTQQMEEEKLENRIVQGAAYLFGVIIVVLFFLRVIRPMVNWVTTSVEVVPDELSLPSAEELEAAEEERRIAKQTQQSMQIRQAVSDFATSDPKYAAGVLRKWLRERS